MPSKRSRSRSRASAAAHENRVPVLMVLAIIGSLALGDAFLAAPDSPRLAHANSSANPYQPVSVPRYITPQDVFFIESPSPSPSSSRSLTSQSKASLQRKLSLLRKSALNVEKKIVKLEDAIDGVDAAIVRATNGSIGHLEERRAQLLSNMSALEKRLAGLHSEISQIQIWLYPMSDQSQ